VNIQLNTVTCPKFPKKFIGDNVVAPFVLLSIVTVTLPHHSLTVFREMFQNRLPTTGNMSLADVLIFNININLLLLQLRLRLHCHKNCGGVAFTLYVCHVDTTQWKGVSSSWKRWRTL